MSTPLSFCDISARFGPVFAPQAKPAEQTSCDFDQLFRDYMRKVGLKHEEDREDAEEDALMALVDAMNPPKDRRIDPDKEALRALERTGKAISEEHGGKVDPTQFRSVQAILAYMSTRAAFEAADRILTEERLEVTGQRELSSPSDPNSDEKEV